MTFSEPAEADIEVENGHMRVRVNGRCDGCGAIIRESQDAETMMRNFTALVEAAGIITADLSSPDAAAIDEMSERIRAAPTTLLACLAAIRKASTSETQN